MAGWDLAPALRRRLPAIAVSLVCSLAAAGCATPPKQLVVPLKLPAIPYRAELQIALQQALQEAQGGYDLGISAAVIVPGYLPWAGAAGHSRPGLPLDDQMLFNVGSVAKIFEAALALELAEQGRLDLDAPISAWLPAYPRVDGRITVRQLLDHSSGLYDLFEHPDFPWIGREVEYDRRWELEQALSRFLRQPYALPGSSQRYSSANYLLLTAILVRAGGAPVPVQVSRQFLDPLELRHSFMSMGNLPPAQLPRVRPWADVDLDGKLDDLHGVPQTWIATLTHPVMFATPLDMARWMQALFHEGRVLSEDSLAQMLAISDSAPDPDGGSYGLGIVDLTELLGVKAIGYGGSTLGSSAAALYLPDHEVALAWAVNTGESPRTLADRLMRSTWSNLSQVLFAHLPASGSQSHDLDPPEPLLLQHRVDWLLSHIP